MVGLAGLVGEAAQADSGSVDQAIQLDIPSGQLGEHALDVGGLRHVAGQRHGPAIFLGGGFGLLPGQICHDQTSAWIA
jgi:hypothetical protein